MYGICAHTGARSPSAPYDWCEGLDGADAELARYVLDLHELRPKNIVVVSDEPTRVVRLSPSRA